MIYDGTKESHDDVIKWKQFPRHGPFVRGIHRSPVNSPHKGRWRGALIFSCDQAALWMVQSVCPSVRPSVCLSVRPSVCHTFLTMFPSSYHHEIFRSYYQWQKWRPCKRSRSEVKGQGHRGHDPNFRFRTVTPVWIHIWWWNDTYSLMLLRRGALLFFKVIRQISRSQNLTQIGRFRTVTPVWIHQWLRNDAQSLK